MYDPFSRGASPVGVRTIELGLASGVGVHAELWYPATERARGRDLDDATCDTFSIARGIPPARQRAVRDAEPQRSTLPLVMYWHGGYGHRREASNICTHLASHGYLVVAPDFPGDNIRDTLPAEDGRAKIASVPIDESARARPSQAVAAVEALTRQAAEIGLRFDGGRIGSCGISMGGFTSLAVSSIDPRFAAAFPMCPMYGTRGPLPQVHRLQGLLRLDDWRAKTETLVLAGELDPMIVLPDLRELYSRLPAPKRLVVLKRAGHMHFGDGAAAGHERYRAAYLSGAFPDPEIDAIALGTAMRPFSELCTEENARVVASALCTAHMDTVLRGSQAARSLLNDGLIAKFGARGLAIETTPRLRQRHERDEPACYAPRQ